MIRSLRLGLAFLLFILCFSAFGQTKPKQDIVIWGVSVGPDTKGTEALVHAFEALHPEYHVRLLSMGAGGMNPQKLMTSIVGNVAPDVIFQDRFTIGDWASRNAFIPLDDFMKRDVNDPACPKASQYYPPVWNEAIYNGKLYGVPYGVDDRILYYNKGLFREKADQLRKAGLDPDRAPRTWSELNAYSHVLTEFDTNGTLKRAGYLPNYGNTWLYLYSFQLNGKFMSDDGRTCTLDDSKLGGQNVKALDFMVKGYDELGGYEKAKGFETGFLAQENDPFIVGKLAMKTDGDWILQDLVKYAPTLDLGTAPAPIPDDRYNGTGDFKNEKEKFITWTGGYCYSIPRGARDAEGGWQFIKFATSTPGRLIEHRAQREWERHRGRSYIPRMSASREANELLFKEFKPADPKFAAAFKLHIDMLDHARMRPPTPVAQELWDKQVAAIEDACLHKHNPQDALQLQGQLVQHDLDAFYNQDKYPLINLWIPFSVFVIAVLACLGLCFVFYKRKNLGSLSRTEAKAGYWFISPWIVGFLVFTLGPMAASLFFSFTQYNVLTPAHWVGGANYAYMFGDDKVNTIKEFTNVFYLAAVGVPLSVFTGLAVALLLNAAARGIRFYRTMFYMPAIVPTVASATLWIWLFFSDPHKGLLNGIWDSTITHWLGLAPPGWLNAESWSKPSLILMGAWGAGSGMILWLAGLKGISSSLYEASSIDGATPRQQFWSVTFPQLSPILFFNIVMGFIGAMQEFDRVYIMKPTESAVGPGESLLVPVYQLFREGFTYFHMGYASAIAWVIFLFILILTLTQFKLSKSWVHYEVEE
jgi:multiple sugar transport system permease protein